MNTNYLNKIMYAASTEKSILAECDKTRSTILANSGMELRKQLLAIRKCLKFFVFLTGSTSAYEKKLDGGKC